ERLSTRRLMMYDQVCPTVIHQSRGRHSRQGLARSSDGRLRMATRDDSRGTDGAGRARALTLATLGFLLNFWAWALLSPLGSTFVERGLTSDSALIVAVPVLVGSLGRIPVGALTDRFGGRVMMPAISLITIVPVLFLGFVGQDSLAALLVGGFFLGIAG